MTIVLMARFVAADRSEIWLSRTIETEALLPVGTRVRFGGDRWEVDEVHYRADECRFVLGVFWRDPPDEAPRNAAELERLCSRFVDAGWTRLEQAHPHFMN